MKALIQIVLAMRYNELLVKSSAKDSRTWLLKFHNFEDGGGGCTTMVVGALSKRIWGL